MIDPLDAKAEVMSSYSPGELSALWSHVRTLCTAPIRLSTVKQAGVLHTQHRAMTSKEIGASIPFWDHQTLW
jgi:hypothetical protein